MSQKTAKKEYYGVHIKQGQLDPAAERRFVGAYNDGVSLEDLRGRFSLTPTELDALVRKHKLKKRIHRGSDRF